MTDRSSPMVCEDPCDCHTTLALWRVHPARHAHPGLTQFALLLFLAVLIANNVIGQSYSEIIRPSPDVKAFEKYGQIPVSTYTGIPEIRIPIYNIVNKEITVPVSLTYHAGGFTVNEEASRVGLGWTLQAGGMISRTIRGIDDFKPVYGYAGNSFPEIFNDQVTYLMSAGSQYNVFGSGNCVENVGGQQVDFSNVLYASDNDIEWMVDLEPDIYNYNFLGYSGSFTINKDLSTVSESKNSLKIELLVTDSTWLVTTPDGVRYYFDVAETNNFYSASATSWYLHRIVSPTGASVNFHYTKSPTYEMLGLPMHSEKTMLSYVASGQVLTTPCSEGLGALTYDYIPARLYRNILLDSITYPFGTTEFRYSDRNDLAGEKRLISIIIRKANYPGQTEFYQMQQDYFTATSTGGFNYPTDPATRVLYNTRLKLNGMVRTTADSVKEKYTFAYNAVELPSKGSYAIDHWGYYNGASNSSYSPKWGYTLPMSPNVLYMGTANREANASYVQACMLKEITYPTGGSTKFEYESNDFDIGNSVNSFSSNGTPEYENYKPTFLTRRHTTGTNTEFFDLEIKPHVGSVMFYIQSQMGSSQGSTPTGPSDMYIEIYPEGSSTYVYRFTLGTENAWTTQDAYFNYGLQQTLNLPAGRYDIKTVVKNNVLFLNYITFSFSHDAQKNISSNHAIRLGGGVRIKKISSIDPVTGTSLVRQYRYRYELDTDGDNIAEVYSYGRKLSGLDYVNGEYTPMCYVSPAPDHPTYAGSCGKTYLYSNNISSATGPTIGYDKVIEIIGEAGEGGMTEYSYFNTPSLELVYSSGGFIPDIRPSGANDLASFTNGLLKEQKEFKFNASGNHTLIAKKALTYETLPTDTKLGIRRIGKINTFSMWQGGCGSSDCEWVFVQYPAFQSGLSRIATQTESSYDQNGNELSVTTSYAYEPNAPVHYNPVFISNTKADGSMDVLITTYPSDYASGTAFIDSLKQAHIFQPIETVTYQDNNSTKTVINGSLRVYYPSGKGLIHKEYALNLDSPLLMGQFKFSNKLAGADPIVGANQPFSSDSQYKEQYAYNFDGKGNVIEIVPTNGDTRKTYLWAYNDHYPIAEIRNASYDEVKTLLGQTLLDRVANASTPSQADIATVNNLRVLLQAAQILTYTYIPLLGIASKTDPNGLTTGYEYDTLKRLKLIKDHNGNIVKHYEYQYKP